MSSWRDVNAIYQIYPRSFKDSNGDGVGDLRGVIEKLDYLHGEKDSLGVDAIWFSPFFKSPMADFGYDVSDYCDIHPLFGTLDDFRELLDKAHKRQIKVMIDFVPNHTSDEHPWFIDSKSSKTSDKSDYYVWRDPKHDGTEPNNWQSIFGGSAWEFDPARGQYYLHTFLKEQPDLNWDNPRVRKEMQNILKFWFDMGVDGIRADAVRWISKDAQFRNDPPNPKFKPGPLADNYGSVIHKYSRFGKDLFRYLRELTDVVAQYDDRIMIFEDYPDDEIGAVRDQYLGFYSINPEVSMPFNFTGIGAPFSAEVYSDFISDFQGMLTSKHMPVYCFGNHDQPRLASRVGGEQARAVALMQLTLPGLPVVYYGDEIGMKNVPIPPDMIQDPVELQKPGLGQGRDPERTPMQWDATATAGFSGGKPWLPVSETSVAYNVASELFEPDSYLALYRRMLKLRTQLDVLRHGDYEVFGDQEDDTFVYARRLEGEHVFIAMNFSDQQRTAKLPHGGKVLCCTHPVDYPEVGVTGEVFLRPYEAALIVCEKHPLVNFRDSVTQ